MKSEMLLASRAENFSNLLECCEITEKNGPTLELEHGLKSVMQMLAHVRKSYNSVFIIGNGGSASVASHAAVDFTNVAKLNALTLHESSLLTCMSNDYGYENAFARILAPIAKPGDVLIAISSSGSSKNICNAAEQMVSSGGAVITLSGFNHDNPLRSMGEINVWLDSNDYGLVEIGHQFILHNMSDRFGGGYMEESSS